MYHFVISVEVIIGHFFCEIVYYFELFGVGVVVDNLRVCYQDNSMSRAGGLPRFPVVPFASH